MIVKSFVQKRKDARGDTTVYGIQASNGLWFRWCYSSERFANELAMRLYIDDATDQAVNWCADPQMCALSDRTKSA